MNWDAIAATAELLGAGGVIISLVYLATQVRSHSLQMRQAAAQSVLAKVDASLDLIAANRATCDVYVRGLKGLAHLSDDTELVQFSALFLRLMRAYEELYYYHEVGSVDSWAWHSVETICAPQISSVGFAEWWALRNSFFTQEFRTYIQRVLPDERRDLLSEYQRFTQARSGGPEVDGGVT